MTLSQLYLEHHVPLLTTTMQKEVILSQLYLEHHVSSIFLHQAHYDNYVDLIGEDQDPDFLAAIEASLLDKQTVISSDASNPELEKTSL